MLLLAALPLCACTRWTRVAEHKQWSLAAEQGVPVDAAAFAEAFDPALAAVESCFGRFEHKVRVHALASSEKLPFAPSGALGEAEKDAERDVPGIGPARVRAWHLRSSSPFGSPSGIYMSTPEPGTAAHELVHARLAELDQELPLWLEEGLASLIGDGFLHRGTWIVDGLACWPMRELAKQGVNDAELARLCSLRAAEASDTRENVLAHFVGWAIVFDLWRETGGLDWREWIRRYGTTIATSEARERMERTLQPSTVDEWLARLQDPRPEVRMAAAKGVWKLRSERVLARLLDALDVEKDVEVQVALSINALAAAGEMPLSPGILGRVWRSVWPRLRRAELADEAEKGALRQLMRSFRYGSPRAAEAPLDALRRFWAE